MCFFVGNDVGGNLSMKGDGHADGQKFLTGTGIVPYRKCSNSEKRFTVIGLIALDGQPVMCVFILKGNRRNLSVETGIDITVIPEMVKKTTTTPSTSIILAQASISQAHRLVHSGGKKSQHW